MFELNAIGIIYLSTACALSVLLCTALAVFIAKKKARSGLTVLFRAVDVILLFVLVVACFACLISNIKLFGLSITQSGEMLRIAAGGAALNVPYIGGLAVIFKNYFGIGLLALATLLSLVSLIACGVRRYKVKKQEYSVEVVAEETTDKIIDEEIETELEEIEEIEAELEHDYVLIDDIEGLDGIEDTDEPVTEEEPEEEDLPLEGQITFTEAETEADAEAEADQKTDEEIIEEYIEEEVEESAEEAEAVEAAAAEEDPVFEPAPKTKPEAKPEPKPSRNYSYFPNPTVIYERMNISKQMPLEDRDKASGMFNEYLGKMKKPERKALESMVAVINFGKSAPKEKAADAADKKPTKAAAKPKAKTKANPKTKSKAKPKAKPKTKAKPKNAAGAKTTKAKK